MATKKQLATSSSAAPRSASPKKSRKTMSRAELLALHDQRLRRVWSIVLFALGILFLFVALVVGDEGNLWNLLHNSLFALLSWCSYFVGPLLIFVAVLGASNKASVVISNKVWQLVGLFVLICATIEVFRPAAEREIYESLGVIEKVIQLAQDGMAAHGGGLIGAILGWPLGALMGEGGAKITVMLVLFVYVMLVTGLTLMDLFRAFAKPVQKINAVYQENKARKEEAKFNVDVPLGDEELPMHPVQSPKHLPAAEEPQPLFRRTPKKGDDADRKRSLKEKLTGREPSQSSDETPVVISDGPAEQQPGAVEPLPSPAASTNSSYPELDTEKPDMGTSAERVLLDSLVNNVVSSQQGNRSQQKEKIEPLSISVEDPSEEKYIRPTLALLDPPAETNEADITEELKTNAALLVDTLSSFGVQTRIVDISRGPAVTRYELQPSVGVKISKITGLADDIALNLASAGVRIEAPIPNKAAVGIEVPNKIVTVVKIREVLESSVFLSAKSKLTVALGKDIEGKVTIADIAKMPHVLIAGATGSGKSICINSILISLLYKSTPEEVRLLLVDPKVVELGIYNGIPHLLIPVVTEPRKAAGALAWAVNEMLNRYKLFADNSVRDLTGYNALAARREDLNPLPQIVIVIDELADLMMAAPNEVENSICRLAQMARAAGMHLIIATQRPSVDVITGIIKANIPSRISFAVTSQVDSRTILDSAGAEKLLGRGDMLFFPVGSSKPTRVQGCYVSDQEVERVIEFIKTQGETEYDAAIIEDIEKQAVQEKGVSSSDNDGEESNDEMLNEAIEAVIDAGQASTSMLQRKLKVGYARAGRLIDEMEKRGIVGPFEGSKPRQVLMSRQQFLEMSMNRPEE